MLSRRDMLAAAAGAASCSGAGMTAGLAGAAARRGIVFGTEVTAAELGTDARYGALVRDHAAMLTPGLEAKWAYVEPAERDFRFAPLDSIVAFARTHGMALHMHNLIWSVGMPPWTVAALRAGSGGRVMAAHIAALAGRYRGLVQAWDVVNEPVDPRWPSAAEGLCHTPWRQFIGANYVADALRAAADADPQARLLINDDDLEYDLPDQEAKRGIYLRLIEGWLRAGVPLHGFGLEAHLKPWLPFADMRYRRFLRELAGFGLKLYITELDVCDRTLPADIIARDAAVAACAGRYLAAALDETAVCAVMCWGLSDRYTYMNHDVMLRRVDGLAARPCPFDADFQTKPFYHVLIDAFRQAPVRL